ncbi:MAG: redoxin domain-containing protein [Acidobacteriota bacterium]|nr:redoxin domain-containing protein [Acidobacteriota bacterium]
MFWKKLFLLAFSLFLIVGVKAQKAAPELTGAKGWLNSDKPLTLAELRGKVVLLDFWTYGCINCIHIIPDLKKLEAKYKNELVVIGVHSGKFDNERDTENIRRIILRYELEHPVVNDADFNIWNRYGVEAYPTQVLINPAGDIVATAIGEGQFRGLDERIQKTISEFRGKINEKPLEFKTELSRLADSPLLFPGKILADAKANRLFVADSNHNRIVVTTLDGTLIQTIGGGDAGFADGGFETVMFRKPQGLAFDGTNLYVADTGNHAIRLVNFETKTVETIAGTGEQGHFQPAGKARTVSLNSPWDLQLVGQELFVAMAGNHQIWRLDLTKNEIGAFAGSGREEREDGSLTESGFAQPSGLAFDGKFLYVADSESNIIRRIDLRAKKVETLVGGDLFEFGDTDGEGDTARLQHPLGVVAVDKRIFIADTYNHKIKSLNPAFRSVRTFVGQGKPGNENSVKASFYEPGGISQANGKLFVADTNNHSIRVINLKTRAVSTLTIKGLESPKNKKQLQK